MRAILDTNVVVSGIFFGGVPGQVLEAWAAGHFELVLSASIYDEYLRTCARLGERRPQLEYTEILARIVGHGTLVKDPRFEQPITADPDDDKFILCAKQAAAPGWLLTVNYVGVPLEIPIERHQAQLVLQGHCRQIGIRFIRQIGALRWIVAHRSGMGIQ